MLILLFQFQHFGSVQSSSVIGHHHVYDLSYAYYEEMPVREGGIPPEISLVEQDEGHGVR